MKHFLIFLFCVVGLYLLLTAHFPGVYRPAARALRARAPKTLTQTEVLTAAIANKLKPWISIDPIQRLRLEETLKTLGHTETPEEFEAAAWARGLLFSAAFLWLPLLSVPLGLGCMLLVCFYLHKDATNKIDREIQTRRQAIERELPQFAGTIQQSLQSTHDVTAILLSYRKVCGKALAAEIDRTLNDMMTGNPESALRSLESRIASPKFGQLTRGLVSVLRGDDQRVYFQMLASEYRKAQNEAIAQELTKRPEKLNPNMGLLFGCLVLMIVASLGVDLVHQMGQLFGA